MAKRNPSYREIDGLLQELRSVRRLRQERKDRIPFRARRQYFRGKLKERAESEWPGGYLWLESGDYLYIPGNMDPRGLFRLVEPLQPEPVIEVFCRPGNTVMDIGANLGEWSLPMARGVGPVGSLFAFEPSPDIFSALSKTLKVNHLPQARAFHLAVSNADGKADFTVMGDSGRSTLGKAGSGNIIRVPTLTLDRFTTERSLQRLDFVKVDVESHELSVLEGGRGTLEKFHPALLIEAGNESREDRDKIAGLLRSIDYGIIGITLPLGIAEVSWDQYLDLSPPFKTSEGVNVLFLPGN